MKLAMRLRAAGAALALAGVSACAGGADAAFLVAAPAVAPDFPDFASMAGADAFDAEGLAALEAAMEAHVEAGRLFGISTLLVKDGKVAHYDKAGLSRLSDGALIEDDTIFRIYSMTKPVTGVALMTLYEEGAFDLDDPVTKFVPELEGLKVFAGHNRAGEPVLAPAKRAPAMAELLSHTAGFAYGLAGDDPANTAFREQRLLYAPDLEAFIDQVADVPLLFQPGEDWAYSAAVDIQGLIVERITGQSFGAALQTRIFDPLDMDDTSFFVPDADLDRFGDVFAYSEEAGGLVPVKSPEVAFLKDTVAMESGGGGLVSTMADYARFCQMLVNGGELDGARILKSETIELMRTNRLAPHMSLFSDGSAPNPDLAGHGFGLGFGVLADAEPTQTAQPEGSYYWGGAAGTWFWIDPVNDLFFIGMIQQFSRGGPDDLNLRRQSVELVYDALKAD